MAATLSSMAPIQINSTVLPVESYGLSLGIIAEIHEHSGGIYPTAERISGAVPRITARIPFRAAYDLIGLTILEATTVDCYMTKYGALIPTAGSTHPKLALTTSCKAAVHITGASVDPDGMLFADVEIFPLSTAGVAHPLTYTQTNALPSITQPVRHTLGPWSHNGTVLPGVTGYGIDFGQRVEVTRHDGDPYAIAALRNGGQPRFSIAHADPFALLNSLTLTGSDITANDVLYFRQYNATTGVIDTGATAISMTIGKGRVKPLEVTNAQGQISTIGVEIAALSTDGTSAPIVVATNATAPAIP
jgi:hypothetical protein